MLVIVSVTKNQERGKYRVAVFQKMGGEENDKELSSSYSQSVTRQRMGTKHQIFISKHRGNSKEDFKPKQNAKKTPKTQKTKPKNQKPTNSLLSSGSQSIVIRQQTAEVNMPCKAFDTPSFHRNVKNNPLFTFSH